MPRKLRHPKQTRISPMARLGMVIQRGNTGRNLHPTLAECTDTWPISPYRPDLSFVLQPRAAMLNFPEAIWFACIRQDPVVTDHYLITIKNPSPAAIREVYMAGWLRCILRAAIREAERFPQFPAFLHAHITDMVAHPERMPSSLMDALNVFHPPWQDPPVWLSSNLR